MNKPCGSYECRRYVENHGGDPDCPSDWMCAGCGAEGPMSWWYNRQSAGNDVDEDEEEED